MPIFIRIALYGSLLLNLALIALLYRNEFVRSRYIYRSIAGTVLRIDTRSDDTWLFWEKGWIKNK